MWQISVSDETQSWSVEVDNDDRVVYAYLVNEGNVVGDVWLCNCNSAPEKAEWDNPDNAPFRNPKGFVSKELFGIDSPDDLEVRWINDQDRRVLIRAEVLLRGRILAILAPNSKPGWCLNAIKDGPLAKVLVIQRT